MLKKIFLMTALFVGCSSQNYKQTEKIQLGTVDLCEQYSGLPTHWIKDKNAGMVFIQGGAFKIGNNASYPEEKSLLQPQRKVNDFWIDRTEVTNAQFEAFVKATGYITQAEQQGDAAVFKPTTDTHELSWWKLVKGANWRHPNEPQDQTPIKPNEPVRMITLADAVAYADWLGRDLPTEEQWEYVAKLKLGNEGEDTHQGVKYNIWHGEFPYENQGVDGYEGVAPVGCYAPNSAGLFDMIGNVWEYTKTPFVGSHDDHMGVSQISTHDKQSHNAYTIKGGSFLCASNYCQRYTVTARHPQEVDLAISHVGFRTVINVK